MSIIIIIIIIYFLTHVRRLYNKSLRLFGCTTGIKTKNKQDHKKIEKRKIGIEVMKVKFMYMYIKPIKKLTVEETNRKKTEYKKRN